MGDRDILQLIKISILTKAQHTFPSFSIILIIKIITMHVQGDGRQWN